MPGLWTESEEEVHPDWVTKSDPNFKWEDLETDADAVPVPDDRLRNDIRFAKYRKSNRIIAQRHAVMLKQRKRHEQHSHRDQLDGTVDTSAETSSAPSVSAASEATVRSIPTSRPNLAVPRCVDLSKGWPVPAPRVTGPPREQYGLPVDTTVPQSTANTSFSNPNIDEPTGRFTWPEFLPAASSTAKGQGMKGPGSDPNTSALAFRAACEKKGITVTGASIPTEKENGVETSTLGRGKTEADAAALLKEMLQAFPVKASLGTAHNGTSAIDNENAHAFTTSPVTHMGLPQPESLIDNEKGYTGTENGDHEDREAPSDCTTEDQQRQLVVGPGDRDMFQTTQLLRSCLSDTDSISRYLMERGKFSKAKEILSWEEYLGIHPAARTTLVALMSKDSTSFDTFYVGLRGYYEYKKTEQEDKEFVDYYQQHHQPGLGHAKQDAELERGGDTEEEHDGVVFRGSS
ncbi:hypothetical protein M011DRAFT_463401, partial [Sporormia fimetaria CBS 119925]